MLIATGSTEVANALAAMFVVLVAAKLGDELFRRLGQPGLIGEIFAGVIIGPAVLGWVAPGEVLRVLAELGAVFLLFWVGLETRIGDLRAVGRPAALAGTLGVIFPFAAGLAVGLAMGHGSAESMFVATALVATSVGITSAVLIHLGLIDTRASRTILGAAIVDDILAMLLLAITTGVSASSVNIWGLVLTVVMAVGFVGFAAIGGTRAMRAKPEVLQLPSFPDSALVLAVIGCLGLATLSNLIGLASIIGAFLAGLIVSESREHYSLEPEIKPLFAFFSPFFFAVIGMDVDIAALTSVSAMALLGATVVVAAATKFAGAWLGARSLGAGQAAFVGVGMIPRGEVGIVIAGIGRTTGVINSELFAVIVGMSIITTLITPPLLRRLAHHVADEVGEPTA